MKKLLLFFLLLFFGFMMYATTLDHGFSKLFKASKEIFLDIQKSIEADVIGEGNSSLESNVSEELLLQAPCSAFVLPFKEGFNSTSTSFDCWMIVDENKDSTTPTGNNIWKQSTISPQEGDRVMQFNGSGAATKHNDWLISPQIKLSGGIYAITYYYKTNVSYDNEFEVLLSQDGTALDKFTHVVLAKATYRNGDYIKKTVYVQGITADVNIAWRVVSTGTTIVYIDNILVEKVDCIAPQDEMIISGLEKDKLIVTIKDDINTSWEYFVQPVGGGVPVGSGTVSNVKAIPVSRVNGTGANLQPNTDYEFYVKSNCGQGKSSLWIGPLKFRTLCDNMVLPFWEGFNKNSVNINCWMFFDANKDATSPTSSNIWKTQLSAIAFEGDQHAYFTGSGTGKVHDDWMISPNFNFVANKIYRLKYHYKTTATNDNEFEVLASNGGTDVVNFTKVVVAKKTYKNDTYMQEVAFISGLSGKVNIAWHVVSTGSTTVYIDNVFVEEVLDCPEPIKLDATNIGIDKATLTWTDDFQATDWEYVVQVPGTGVPVAKGTATKSKSNNLTKDSAGKNLEANTEYEVYARTSCGNGKYSIWSGPFLFKTNCSIFTTPFWEGFNVNSKTLRCWTVVNNNNDSYFWKPSTINYEGGQSMYFYGYGAGTFVHDDWVISPVVKFESNKIYRLKYHYRASDYDNEFEVLLSNSGMNITDFKKVVVAKNKYRNSTFVEETVFISEVSGDVNIAIHAVTKGISYLYLDNLFIEEVIGCPEPLKLDVKDVGKDKATISWTDSDVYKGTGWEYFVQEVGTGTPTTAGVNTTVKENIVIKEQSGKNLMPNTEYEYYVRTVCGNGSFSIWSGPYVFYTTCDVYKTPFVEGFNLDSKTLRCWTIVDGNKDSNGYENIWKSSTDGFYEGNQAMGYFGLTSKSDDWLISPMVELDGGQYILKYYYQTGSESYLSNEFEVLLSTEGVAVDKFTQTLVSKKKYDNSSWVEEVVFIDNVQGVANLAWHVVSSTGMRTKVNLDHIILQKVTSCPEPYTVKVTGSTANSLDIEWLQNGGITNWEVEIAGYGDQPTGLAANIKKVSGAPKTTLLGLNEGQSYSIFVRAICSDGVATSEWSTALNTSIKVGQNDICSGAINIPVNSGLDCVKTVSGTLFGANISTQLEPFCQAGAPRTDVWFEFTATATMHLLKMLDVYSNQEGNGSGASTLNIAVYDQDCSNLGNTAISCFAFNSVSREGIMLDLIPGKKYFVRVATTKQNPDFIFNLCITTSKYSSLEVSPSGDKYTVEQLVKEVLVKSNCDLVSNIKYQAGDHSGINTFGYFNKGNSNFPFQEGIVLATHDVDYVSGPYRNVPTKNKVPAWTGDTDLNEVIKQVGGVGFEGNKFVSVLEFDFIPIKDSINFEYLFASESYHQGCQYACKEGGALFAAWLTEIATGEGRNLALVPGTTEPIALSTIRDSNKSGAACKSVNAEFFDKYFNDIQSQKLDAPINYIGMTVPMKSEMVHVKAGKKYRIKLAIADFCPVTLHTSAVFFNAASFDLGTIDLGKDLLVESNNALCDGETKTIKSGLTSDTNVVAIEWFKDGILLPNEKSPNLEVSSSGNYGIKAKYLELDCETSGSVKVEIYPALSTVLNAPLTLPICRISLNPLTIDLTDVEEGMLEKVDPLNYKFTYFKTKSDAESEENPILAPQGHLVEINGKDVSIYIRVEDLHTGCTEVFPWMLKSIAGIAPVAREDVFVCANYTFPELEDNQYYYTGNAATGVKYDAGDVLEEPGLYTIFVFQDNGSGCYEQTSFRLSITAMVKADIFEDKELECEFYQLKPLSDHNRYFTQSGGQGNELAVGSFIPYDQTIYVYAASEDRLCVDESSFKITYRECPIQKGISPNGDGLNDRFDLSKHGATSVVIYNRYGAEVYSFQGDYTNQWGGQNKSNQLLPDGTYFYVVVANGKTRTGWVQINK